MIPAPISLTSYVMDSGYYPAFFADQISPGLVYPAVI